MALRLRRGTDAERQGMIGPLEGELVYTTDTNKVYVGGRDETGDLVQGGILVSGSLLDDPAPTLSANLSLNGHDIVGTGNINIDGTITATGTVNLGDGVEDNVIVGGQIGSSLIPGTTDAYNLGDSLARWNEVNAVSVSADNVSAESMTVDGEISVGSIVTDGNIITSDSTIIYNATTGSITVQGTVNAASFKGTVVGDDSTVLVDGVANILSNGKVTISGDSIFGSTNANGYDNTLSPFEPIVTLGNRIDPQVMFIEGNNFPLTIRGVSDGLQGTNLSIQASKYANGYLDPVQNGDFLGQLLFEAWTGEEFKKSSVLSSQIASNISGGSFDSNLQVSVLNADGLYRQFMFKSDGTFDSGLGLVLYNATDSDLSDFSAIATEGTVGYGADRSSTAVFDGTAFRTLTSTVDVPASPTAAGKAGQIAGDADYIYFCYDTDSWVRVAKDGTW